MNGITLTTDLLAEAGYESLTEQEAGMLLKALYDAGAMIVGANFASRLSNEEQDAFERFIDANEDELALGFIEQHFPSYREEVRQIFDMLIKDLRRAADETRLPHVTSSFLTMPTLDELSE